MSGPTEQERLAALIDDTVRWIRLQRGATGGWLHPKLNRPDAVASEVELRLSHVKAGLSRLIADLHAAYAAERPEPEEGQKLRAAVRGVIRRWQEWIARWGSERRDGANMMQSCLDELRDTVNRLEQEEGK